MRIARNFDNDPDDNDDKRDNIDQAAERLIDEAEDFLAELAAANPHTADAQPEPADVAASAPAQPPQGPRLRLIKTTETTVPVEDEHLPPALRLAPVLTTTPVGRRVPRWVRGALPGSLVVVLTAAVLANGQPGTVAAPLAIYAAGWAAYLAWSAAYRPPLIQITATAIALLTRTFAAVVGGTARRLRRSDENSRTAAH